MRDALVFALLLTVPLASSVSGCRKAPETEQVDEAGLKTIFADGEDVDVVSPAPKAQARAAAAKPAAAAVDVEQISLPFLQPVEIPPAAELEPEIPLAAAVEQPAPPAPAAPRHWQLELNKELAIGACLERELHDGQWLAGGCRDVVHVLHRGVKAAHVGVALMSNAEHGNRSVQVKAGVDLGGVRDLLWEAANWSRSPTLEELGLPPWLGKVGAAASIDFMGGWRPMHDQSVNGSWTYGVGAHVEIPIDKAFEWLKVGL